MRLILAAVSFLLGLQGAPTATATVEGMVVKADGSPVAVAGVELSRNGTPIKIVPTTEEGKFVITDVTPGEYRLAAAHLGYVRSEYGQRGPNSRGIFLKIAGGQTYKDLRVTLIATASIYGRVFDKTGSLMANVQVQALRYTYQNGRRVLSTSKAVYTNDLGEYRLFWLPPGIYYVSATPFPGSVPEVVMRPAAGGYSMIGMPPAAGAMVILPGDEGATPSFFPAGSDPGNAQPIDLKAGDSRGGIDIRIAAVATKRLRGTVLNIPPSNSNGQAPTVRVQIAPRESLGAIDAVPLVAVVVANGDFEVRGIAPGRYNVVATAFLPPPPGTPNPPPSMSGTVPIEVLDANIDGLKIQLEPTSTIPVQVAIDGQTGDTPEMRRLRIGVDFAVPLASSPQQPGLFLLPAIAGGDHRLNITQLADNAYIKSVRSGNIDVLADGFRVGGPDGPPQIQVTIGVNGGVIEGTTLNDKREPQSNITVALVPEPNRRSRPDLYKSIASDASGQFRLTGIAPGDYRVFAWEDIEPGAWQDSVFLLPYEARGNLVRISEGSRENTQVTAIGAR